MKTTLYYKVIGFPNIPKIDSREFCSNGETREETARRAYLNGYYPTVEQAVKSAIEISVDERAWRQRWEDRVRSLWTDHKAGKGTSHGSN